MGIFDNLFRQKQQPNLNNWYSNADLLANLNNQILASAMPTINEDSYDYIGAQRKIAPVYDATDLIMQKVIASPIVTYRVKDREKLERSKQLEKSDPTAAFVLKKEAIEEVKDLSLNKLLQAPNPYQTQKQFIWSLGLMYLLQGNAYVYGNKTETGKALELFPIANMKILVNTNDQFDPIRGYQMMYGQDVLSTFRKDQIYHLKTGTPANLDWDWRYIYGISPLRPHLENMRTIDEAEKQASKQVRNGGVFGILSPKAKEDEFSAPQRQQLHDKMKQARSSNDELARVFPSSISLDWKQIGLTSADLQLAQLTMDKCKAIYRTYHIPEQYLSSERSSYNNVSTAVKQLIYDAVAPLCHTLSEMLTKFVGKEYGDIIIELDYTQLPEMAINMAEMTKYLEVLVSSGIITPNEARVALRYGEVDDPVMNQFRVQGNANSQDIQE